MTSTKVVYYIDTPDGEEPVGSPEVFNDILEKLALAATHSNTEEEEEAEIKMTGLARFAKLYKLRYLGRGYIEEFFYTTLDGRSICISFTSEKPGAIKIFERVKGMLGDNVGMVYSMLSIDNETNEVTAVNTDRHGWFFNERVASLVTINPELKQVNEELFEALVSSLCNVYYGRDFNDLAHRIFHEQHMLPVTPEQITIVFEVIAKCIVAGLGGNMEGWGKPLVNVVTFMRVFT